MISINFIIFFIKYFFITKKCGINITKQLFYYFSNFFYKYNAQAHIPSLLHTQCENILLNLDQLFHILRNLNFHKYYWTYLLFRLKFLSNSCIRFSSLGTLWDSNSRSWTWFKLDDNSSLVVFNSRTRLRLKRENTKYFSNEP